jgi:hypothetical protein
MAQRLKVMLIAKRGESMIDRVKVTISMLAAEETETIMKNVARQKARHRDQYQISLARLLKNTPEKDGLGAKKAGQAFIG